MLTAINKFKKIMWNNVEYTDDQNTTEIFNQHFCSVAVKLEQNVWHRTQDPLNYLSNRIAPYFFSYSCYTRWMLSFDKRKKNTEQTKDFIPVKMLISYQSFFVHIIANMINTSFFFHMQHSLIFSNLLLFIKKATNPILQTIDRSQF